MESIHADIAMPLGYSGESYNDFKYIVNFVDDHSGYMYCMPLIHKSDVIDAFHKFLLYSRKFGEIKKLRTDQALEFESKKFAQFSKDWRIHHTLSGKYAPAQDGVAERSFGTLHPHARCILNTTHLGHYYWPFAYQYAAELYNRSYIRRIDRRKPQLGGKLND